MEKGSRFCLVKWEYKAPYMGFFEVIKQKFYRALRDVASKDMLFSLKGTIRVYRDISRYGIIGLMEAT
jgi:hypothetical protein